MRLTPARPGRSPRPRAVFLAGFMGSGKSTIGAMLAREFGWSFVDLDAQIETRENAPIPEIFARRGEAAFRAAEREALLEQAAQARAGKPRVVALGGGSYASAENRSALRAAGVTVWLDADAATLWNRVRETGHRPLAKDRSAFEALHRARRASYASADARVDAGGPPAAVLRRILGVGSVKELAGDG